MIAVMQVGLSIANALWVFVAVRAVIGAGYGLLQGTITSATLDWEHATGRKAMNVLHAAFSGGGVFAR